MRKLLVGSLLTFLAIIPSGCDLSFLGRLPFIRPPAKEVSLAYWGLFEPPEVLQPLIEEYQNLHPNVKINYEQRNYSSLAQHKETLLTRLREETGPDIARVHITWIPQFASELAPLPPNVYSREELPQNFYPVAVEALTLQGGIYGIPLMYDGLMLFYNQNHFEKAGIGKPPSDWEEFREAAAKLTQKDEQGKIIQAGAAMGTANNVAHFSDILGLMWAQSQIKVPPDLGSPAARDALIFYTNFVTKDEVWDASLPYSIQAFASGRVSMIFAPSWRVFDIQNLNPGLKFKVAAVPQVPSLPRQPQQAVNWASFWVEVISLDSENREEAWDFLKFLSEAENMRRLYAEQAKIREFGEPYSRVDLGQSLLTNDFLAPLIDGAPTAVSYLIADASGNDVYTEAVAAAVNSVLQKKDVDAALSTLKQTLERF